jgi:hypothetical protein
MDSSVSPSSNQYRLEQRLSLTIGTGETCQELDQLRVDAILQELPRRDEAEIKVGTRLRWSNDESLHITFGVRICIATWIIYLGIDILLFKMEAKHRVTYDELGRPPESTFCHR